jgi:flagellar hook-basal body complex protein FliE
MDRIRGIAEAPALPDLDRAERPAGGASFADALGKAIASADALQVAGDGEVQKLAYGGGNLHETSLALEKADTAMRVLMKVRNKVVDAYQEIMRMSV